MLGLEILSLFYFNYSSYRGHSNSSQFPLDLKNKKKEEINSRMKKEKKSQENQERKFVSLDFVRDYLPLKCIEEKKNPWNRKKNSNFF